MRRVWAILAFVFGVLPITALAQDVCGGEDLIDLMPPDERQALLDEVAREPYAEGLLWRATKGDTVIEFFGTYHFRHAQTDAHLERLKPMIEAADTVYLEISNADQTKMEREMARDPALMFITEGPTLVDLLGEEDWKAFSEAMRERNIPGFMAAKFKPFWATMMLGIGPCEARSGALEDRGIDVLVGEYAEELGTGSKSLDDFIALLKLLDEDPLEQQLNLIRLTLAWPGNVDDMSYTIRERYLAEEIGLTWAFSKAVSLKYGGPTAEADFARFTELLLEDRNRKWVDTLVADTQPGERVFVAFGAGHLPGEIGVLWMLEQEGFAIERLEM